MVGGGIREDAWLARVLGRPAFSVDPDAALPDRLPAGFFWCKTPVENTGAAARLCGAGFVPVDVNVTLSRPPGAGDAVDAVRPAEPGDAEALLDIAGRSFAYSRFHLDPRLPNGLADRVKREWVQSYLDGARGLELLTAVDAGRPVGFLAVLEAEDARVIDLVAVAPEARGRGHGAALVSAFVARHSPDARELRVGTQAANAPSIRLYERLGFAFAGASYVLHLHT